MKHEWSEYFDTSSEYWKKVQKIYEENEHFPKIVIKDRNLHHKFPRSFSKKDGVEVDNDEDNLISLPLASHFIVHYYLWKCCIKKGYRSLMALAFQYMRKKAIKYASDETIEELALDYAAVMKDVSDLHSIIGKKVTASEKWRESMSKVDWEKVSEKRNETIKNRYSTDELKAINTKKGDFCRGKTYEELYGEEEGKRLRNLRGESNHNRIISDETKKKISQSHKGKHPSEETRKKLSKSHKGRKLSDEDKKKKSLAAIGRRWYNNGKIQIFTKGNPPDGFIPGMLKQKEKAVLENT